MNIEIAGKIGAELYLKKTIQQNGKTVYVYSTIINPHIKYSNIQEFVDEERKELIREKMTDRKIYLFL